jgi:hypothetical protein
MFLGFLTTVASCTLNSLSAPIGACFFYCTLIFYVVSVCISLTNCKSLHLCMRLKYMHEIYTVVEDLRSKYQSQTWAVFQLRLVGLARPLRVVSNNVQVLFCTKGSVLLSVLAVCLSLIKCTYVNRFFSCLHQLISLIHCCRRPRERLKVSHV